MYAGVNGANEYQGDPPAMKFSPRLGFVHSFNPKTVLRAGYGVYWAPWNYQGVGAANYGNIGFSQQTFISQNQYQPANLLANPFPNGILSPVGNQLGALAGVGGQMEFIDQDKKAPYIQQYSIDINRELPGNLAVGFEYSGATGRDLGLGGSNDGIININQVPREYLALGTRPARSGAEPVLRAARRQHRRRALPAGQEHDEPDDSAPRAAASLSRSSTTS